MTVHITISDDDEDVVCEFLHTKRISCIISFDDEPFPFTNDQEDE